MDINELSKEYNALLSICGSALMQRLNLLNQEIRKQQAAHQAEDMKKSASDKEEEFIRSKKENAG